MVSLKTWWELERLLPRAVERPHFVAKNIIPSSRIISLVHHLCAFFSLKTFLKRRAMSMHLTKLRIKT